MRAAQVILNRIVNEQDGMQSAMLLDADGKLLAGASEDKRANLAADLPTAAMLQQAAMPGGYTRPEGGIERDFKESAATPANAPERARRGHRPAPAGGAGGARTARRRAALPAAGAGGAGQPGHQCRSAAQRLQRIPGALRGAGRAAQDVHRNADPDPAAGHFRRGRQRLPDRLEPGAAAAGAGRGHPRGGRGRPVAAPDRGHLRRAGHADRSRSTP